jgi:hypothetical protein
VGPQPSYAVIGRHHRAERFIDGDLSDLAFCRLRDLSRDIRLFGADLD